MTVCTTCRRCIECMHNYKNRRISLHEWVDFSSRRGTVYLVGMPSTMYYRVVIQIKETPWEYWTSKHYSSDIHQMKIFHCSIVNSCKDINSIKYHHIFICSLLVAPRECRSPVIMWTVHDYREWPNRIGLGVVSSATDRSTYIERLLMLPFPNCIKIPVSKGRIVTLTMLTYTAKDAQHEMAIC